MASMSPACLQDSSPPDATHADRLPQGELEQSPALHSMTRRPSGCVDQIAHAAEGKASALEHGENEGGAAIGSLSGSRRYASNGIASTQSAGRTSVTGDRSTSAAKEEDLELVDVQGPQPCGVPESDAEQDGFSQQLRLKKPEEELESFYSDFTTARANRAPMSPCGSVEKGQDGQPIIRATSSGVSAVIPVSTPSAAACAQSTRFSRVESAASGSDNGQETARALEVIEEKSQAHSRWARANWWAMQESRRREDEHIQHGRRRSNANKHSRGSILDAMEHKLADMKTRWKANLHWGASGRRLDLGSSDEDRRGSPDLEASSPGGVRMPSPPPRSPLHNRRISVMLDKMGSALDSLGRSESESFGARTMAGGVEDEEASAGGRRGDSGHWGARLIRRLQRGLRSKTYTVSFLVLTLYVLFGEDVYILCDPPVKYDVALYSVSTAAFIVYSLDLIARSIAEQGYGLSFLFWLDVLATISLIPSVVHALGLTTHSESLDESLHLLRSGRAATMGARLARFVRVMHMANRVLAEYSMHNSSISHMARNIDRHLSRHVITAVGFMLLIVLLLSFIGETDATALIRHDLAVLDAAWTHVLRRPLPAAAAAAAWETEASAPQSSGDSAAFAKFLAPLEESLRELEQRLLYLTLQGEVLVGDAERVLLLRDYPPQWIAYKMECGEGGAEVCEMHLESKLASFSGAKQNIILVASLIGLLGGIAAFLSSSARKELLTPIERVVNTLDQITLQPWTKLEEGTAEGNAESETMLSVNAALKRVGGLLQLGFGEAGMKIISKRLYEGKVDFTRKGNVVYAIFGFCDIRNFTDCTEVLGADIVNLVNNVASHVHDAVIHNGGAPNKNIGDAFLLVWKPKGDTILQQVADSALRSNVTTMIEMQRCRTLRRWELRNDIQMRMPGYRVSMGFGLHYGWAIEGAIGSHHKIDASYLSMSVNLASRLEAATKQYGTPILMSGDLHHLLSDNVRELCRLVDRVTVKGSTQPILLYTYDAPLLRCRGGDIADDTTVEKEAPNEAFFSTFRPSTSEDFKLRWAKAVSRYLGGPDGTQADWAKAVQGLARCLQLRPDDGPALALLSIIRAMAHETPDGEVCAPAGWPGYRALTEK